MKQSTSKISWVLLAALVASSAACDEKKKGAVKTCDGSSRPDQEPVELTMSKAGTSCSAFIASLANLTNCATDKDGDGICDDDEKNILGTSTSVKDVFVELDYMVNNAEAGMDLKQSALDMIRKVYATRKIVLHIDVGDKFSSTPDKVDPENYNYCGGEQIALVPKISLGGSSDGAACGGDCASVTNLKASNFDANRENVFHYAVLGQKSSLDTPDSQVAGLAYTPGKELYISMGGLNDQPANHIEGSQAITLMHELGHNLNLGHNGDAKDNVTNANPTYESVMNYTMGFGMNELGTGVQWRNYMVNLGRCDATYGPYPSWLEAGTRYKIDYSYGQNCPLDEASVDESVGYNVDKDPVDFDCNGKNKDELSKYDLTDVDGEITKITDYNDWGNILYTSISPTSAKPGSTITQTATVCYKPSSIPAIARANGGKVPERRVSISRKL